MNGKVILTRTLSGPILLPFFLVFNYFIEKIIIKGPENAMEIIIGLIVLLIVGYSVIFMPLTSAVLSLLLNKIKRNSMKNTLLEFLLTFAFGFVILDFLVYMNVFVINIISMQGLYELEIIVCISTSISNVIGVVAIELLYFEKETSSSTYQEISL
ncbi:MAG: hypothetical protein QXL15_04195 [Candidatus Korarchaeota archaeon]